MDVVGWLRSLGLGQYEATFRANEIDTDVLPDLTESDLEKMGIPLGPRKRLLKAISGLDLAPADARPTLVALSTGKSSAARRQLTVMFCDLVGSTAMSARLDPEDTREVIRAYQDVCSGAVARYDGFVAKFMGDGVLAYFGFPRAHEDDAERAVRAGLDIVAAVAKLETSAKETLKVRIGVATGIVVVGDLVGQGSAQEQSVVGDTPNLAARLQVLADPGTLVIAESTRRLLGKTFELTALGPLFPRGFDAPVPAWAVLRATETVSRFEASRSQRLTPFVGREHEVALLLDRWREAREGRGQAVLLSGEAGIGKSRILAALREGIGAETHVTMRYQCSPHHVNDALYPIARHISHFAGLVSGEPPARQLDKLDAMIAPTGLAADEIGPYLAALLSIPFEGRFPPIEMSPANQKERTLKALIDLFTGLTKHVAALVLLEDVHWIDPTSLDLFSRFVDGLPRVRALLVITFRPEFVAPWQGHAHVTSLSLNRFERRQAVAMIERVAGSRTLPAEVLEQIVAKTDGVPLFIEELTKAVLESGVLRAEGGTYVLPPALTPLSIPSTLQDSLMARLDRLAPVREIAQIGAAIGRAFSYRLLEAVAPIQGPVLQDALGQLMAAELIYGRGAPPEAIYTFKHALVQDTAYASLLRDQRQRIHARIAATLEGQFPNIAVTQPAMLARHFSEAGVEEKAAAYWLKAGRGALARSAAIEAAAQLRRGLTAVNGLPHGPERLQQELDLQLALGLALMATKGYAALEVGETLARARALAEQIDRPGYLWPVFLGQSSFHRVRGEHRQALALAQQLEKIGEARSDVTAQLVGRWANGRTRLFLGDFVGARALLEQCHGLADPTHRGGVSSADPYSMMLAYLAWTLAILGYIDQSRLRLNEALSEARRLRHVHTLADVLLSACAIGSMIGSPEMKTQTEEMLTLSTERGLALNLGWATVWRGELLTAPGQVEQGLSQIAKGMALVRGTGAITGVADLLMMLAGAHGNLGRHGDGLNCLVEAEQMIEKTDERYKAAELHRMRGDALDATGDPGGAEQSYHQALGVARLQNARLFELRASVSLARLWRGQRRPDEARELLLPIYSWFTEGFDAPDLKGAKAMLEELR